MASLATFLVRHRWKLMPALALLTCAAGWRAMHLELDLSFRNFVPRGESEGLRKLLSPDAASHTAGVYIAAIVRASGGGDLFRKDAIDAIAGATTAIADIPHIDEVTSLVTVFFLGESDRIPIGRVGPLLNDGVDPLELKGSLLTNPLYARRIVSEDGRVTAILARLAPDLQGIAARRPTIQAFRAAAEAIHTRVPDLDVQLAGYPIAEAETATLLQRGFVQAELVALALMALVLAAGIGTVVGVLVPLVVVGIASILTLGFMDAVGLPLTLTTLGVPLLILVIGVSENCFYVVRYYEEASQQPASAPELAVRVVTRILPPAFMAAATTVAGFLSLATTSVGVTRDFGLAMAVGSAFSSIVAAIVVAGTLAELRVPAPHAPKPRRSDPIARVLAMIATVTTGRPRVVLLTGAAVLLSVVVGTQSLDIEQFATGDLPPDHPVRQVQHIIDGSLMGSFETKIVVEPRDGGSLLTPSRLHEIQGLQNFLAGQAGVVKAWSAINYLDELTRQADGAPQLASDETVAAQQLAVLFALSPTGEFPNLLDRNGRWAVIALGTNDLGAERLVQVERDAQHFLDGGELTAHFTGDYWLVSQGVSHLVHDLTVSTLTSFILVFALVALFFRSWRLTVLTIPPNLLPLAAALGLMGVAHMSLRAGTSMILPMSLGIAVNGTIQLLARIRQEWTRERNYAVAIRRALAGTGRGMVISGVALVIGFLAYLIPDFLTFRHIGLIASWTLLVALLADLFLTPALVVCLQPLGKEGTRS